MCLCIKKVQGRQYNLVAVCVCFFVPSVRARSSCFVFHRCWLRVSDVFQKLLSDTVTTLDLDQTHSYCLFPSHLEHKDDIVSVQFVGSRKPYSHVFVTGIPSPTSLYCLSSALRTFFYYSSVPPLFLSFIISL